MSRLPTSSSGGDAGGGPEGGDSSDSQAVDSRRTARRIGIAGLALIVIAGVGIAGYFIGRSSVPTPSVASSAAPVVSTQGRQIALPRTPSTTSSTSTTTTAPPATTTTTIPPNPEVADCGGAPVYEPTILHLCTSGCSSYITNIVWHTWGQSSATGTGTYVTKTTSQPTGHLAAPCAASILVPHPGTPAVLADPQYEPVCENGIVRQVLVFTNASWWSTGGAPALIPHGC